MVGQERKEESFSWIGLLPLAFLFALLWIPLDPTPFEPDSYELLIAAQDLGIAHPPGYSIYLTLCHYFIWIASFTGVSASFSISLFSYLCSAVSLILLYGLFQTTKASLFAGLMLISCRGFWYGSIVIEVYSLQLLLLLVCLHFFSRRSFKSYVFTASLLIVHHSFLAVLLFVLGLFGFASEVKKKDVVPASILFILPPSFHLIYLLMRGSIPSVFNVWASFDSIVSAIWHSFALEFAQSFLSIPSLSDLMQLLRIFFMTVPIWFWIAGFIVYLLAKSMKRLDANREAFIYPILALIYFLQCSLYQIHDIWVYLFLVQFFLILWWAKLIESLDFEANASKVIGFAFLMLFVLCFARIPVENPFDEHKILRQTLLIQAARIDHTEAIFVARRFDFLFPLMFEQRKFGQDRVLPTWVFKNSRYYSWYQKKFPNRFKYPDFLALEANMPTSLVKRISHMNLKEQHIAMEFVRLIEFVSINQESHPFYFEVNEDLLWILKERSEGYVNYGSWNQYMPQDSSNPILLMGLGSSIVEAQGVEDRVYLRQGELASIRIARNQLSNQNEVSMRLQCSQGMEGVQDLKFPINQEWLVLTLTNPQEKTGTVECVITNPKNEAQIWAVFQFDVLPRENP